LPLPGGPVLNLPNLLHAGLGDSLTPLTSAAAGTSFGVGAFRITAADPRPVIDRLELFDPAAVVVDPVTPAAGELDRFRLLDIPAAGRLVDRIRYLPPQFVLPYRPQRRAVHVGGNDVVAAGPALLVLAEGTELASVTVVGNELETTSGTGAVYLRQVDTTVFAANRCECLPGVTVAVLRGRRSVLTVTGNVVLGSQPAIPSPPPIPFVRPHLDKVGDLTLAVAVGPEASVSVPLDAVAMLKVLDQPGKTVFADRAAESETLFGRFARRADVTGDPRIRDLLAAGTAGKLIQLGGGGSGPLILRPIISRPVVAPAAGPEAPPAPVAAPTAEEDTVRLLVDTTNKILAAPELDGVAKLFGVATTTGMTTSQARALVQAQLTAAGGDADAALSRGLVALTGVEDVAPTVAGKTTTTLLEDVVGLALRSKLLGTGQTPPIVARPPVPRPVDPATRSLVVLGGSRVGMVNNITTAGVHVQDAGQTVENNL
jgi:hypothetical protein